MVGSGIGFQPLWSSCIDSRAWEPIRRIWLRIPADMEAPDFSFPSWIDLEIDQITIYTRLRLPSRMDSDLSGRVGPVDAVDKVERSH